MAKKPSKAATVQAEPQITAQAPQLTEEELGQLRTRNTAAAFGEAVAALMRSPTHRTLTLAELETVLVPAMITGQFVIGHAPVPNKPGETVPAAILLWASVSDDIDARFSAQKDGRLILERNEWRSGSHVWIIEGAGPAGALQQMLAEFETTALKGGKAKKAQSAEF